MSWTQCVGSNQSPLPVLADATTDAVFEKRAEQLGVAEFVSLTQRVAHHQAASGAELPDVDLEGV